MRFGVLGQVQVWTGAGEPVAVAERKVRALLADLLVHVGRPLSADRLIDDLWGEDLPAHPLGALQLKVSRLRRAFEGAEAGAQNLVVHGPPGYVLQVDAGAVDAGAFEDLVTRARVTADPHDRAALLAQALELWRGPAFADFGADGFVFPAAHRLEEERLAAVEAQAEARLELGEHGVLVAELSDLVDRYPLRERLRAVLIRALYRAGRQSDALASFMDLRGRLADELGLDPSPELLSLQQAILEQDPTLNPPPVTAEPVGVPRSNLPAALTSLIGREEAVEQVGSLLDTGRLVTLTGVGGVGKTRLAVEAARHTVEAFPDGVWFVELAGLGKGDREATDQDVMLGDVPQVALAVMAAIGIRDDGAMSAAPLSLVDALADALRDKRLLLVLDNCEHIVEPVAKLVERVLMAAPGVRVLATSREPLGFAGEAIWMVPPLAVPDVSAGLEPAVLEQVGAVRLFVERATAAAPHFALSADNAGEVVELCRRLDGIPLALELAASRVRGLGVRELVTRLDDRFRLLAGGRTGAPERQRTLRAMIDWSWELLSGPERVVLRRLAVHAKGCTLHAAEVVCSDGVGAEDVLDLMARLVDRSLVVVTDDTDDVGGPRYRLLESVAEYCLERLREADELEHVQQRHDIYYLELAKRAEPYLRGHQQREWLERLDRESDNLRSALYGLIGRNDAAGALDLVNALAWYWFLRGRLGEARNALERALARGGDAPATVRATALSWQAGLEILTGRGTDHQATQVVLQDIEDPRDRARAQLFLGSALLNTAKDLPISEERIGQALATFHEIDDRWGVAAVLSTAAMQALARGDLRAVKRHGQEGSELFRELGDRWGQLQALRPLAYVAEATGDYEQAARLLREGLRTAEELRFWTEVANRLAGLGRIALLGRDFTRARELYERAKRLAIEQNYKPGELYAEIGLATIARKEGNLDLAEEQLTPLLEWHRKLGSVHRPAVMGSAYGSTLILVELGFIAEQRGDAETALARHLEGLRIARTTNNTRTIALALEGMAGAHALAGHHEHAAQLLGAAKAARQAAGAPLPQAERDDVDRITTTACTALGAEAFTTAFERGSDMDARTYAEDLLRDADKTLNQSRAENV